MLGKLATSGLQLEAGALDGVAGDTLIHTGYFEDDDILKIIAWHISQMAGVEVPTIDLGPGYVEWIEAFKSTVRLKVLGRKP